jgi:hypothetical protein
MALCSITGASSAQDFPTEQAPAPWGTCFESGAGLIGGSWPDALGKPTAIMAANIRTDRAPTVGTQVGMVVARVYRETLVLQSAVKLFIGHSDADLGG